jgi:DNA-directed RNA polymerase specialized sigma24 family protein
VGAFTTGEGFAAIVPMHAPAMLRVATALIGPADAEDAVQEAAMRAWQAWATLRNPDAARPNRLSRNHLLFHAKEIISCR